MSVRYLRCLVVAMALLGCTGTGLAASAFPSDNDDDTRVLDLGSAWRLAQDEDASYQAAQSEREAGKKQRALGRSGMLPQVHASASRTKTWGHLKEPGPFGDKQRKSLDYTARENEIEATQKIFDWSEINEWRQGNAKADKSLAVFDTKVRDTATRLVNRYLQALLTQEKVELTKQNLRDDKQHVKIAKDLYERGEGTITDVQEAKAKQSSTRADLVEARTSLAVARRELQEMTGDNTRPVQRLKSDFEPKPLHPSSLGAWIAQAKENNADIHEGEKEAQVASREVDKAIGQMLPTLEATGSYSRDHSDTLSLLDVDSRVKSIGAQLEVPIFSGGENWARMQQSRYESRQSKQELAATNEEVEVEVTRQYQETVSGAEHIKALEKAVDTSQKALAATRKSYKGGERSINDILDTQQQLYEDKEELLQARLDYVNARIQLKAAAGSLNDEAMVKAADEWFGQEAVAQQ